MNDYVREACDRTIASGRAIDIKRMALGYYHDGAVVGPVEFEFDEFCGQWFVQFGMALSGRFFAHRLDLGQARFRIAAENDVQYPGAIRKNQAEVKRDELIDALDERFGMDQVNTTPTTSIEAMRLWERFWPAKTEES